MKQITVTQQIQNAILWIDNLPNQKQAPTGSKGRLGDATEGFCCLGGGCATLNITYNMHNLVSRELMNATGLAYPGGAFFGFNKFYNQTSLAGVNDATLAGFKRISKLMRTHPEWMFTKKAAKGLRKHYENRERQRATAFANLSNGANE